MYHILIVDDSPVNTTSLKNLLDDTYQVSTAAGGECAFKIIKENPPDIILLTTMMPEMNGYEVCRQLKASEDTATIPIIFITAETEVGDERKGLTMGAVDFITRPISPFITRARIKNHLEFKKMRDHLEELTEHSIKLRQKMSGFEIRDKMNRFHLQGPDNTPNVLMVSLPMGRS